MLELLIIPFYVWYFSEYLISRYNGLSHMDAYLNISFEQEAYYGENIASYASKPRWYGFLKYIKFKNPKNK